LILLKSKPKSGPTSRLKDDSFFCISSALLVYSTTSAAKLCPLLTLGIAEGLYVLNYY